MSNELKLLDEAHLGVSLHDGILESLVSDALNRSITITVDVPYLWSFHALPSETRFRLILSGVRLVEALHFSPWPGALSVPDEISWREQEELRKQNYDKGRLESMDWRALGPKLEHMSQYEFSRVTLTRATNDLVVLMLDITDHLKEYFEVRVSAQQVRFYIDANRELTLNEFIHFGKAYWDDFGKDSSCQ